MFRKKFWINIAFFVTGLFIMIGIILSTGCAGQGMRLDIETPEKQISFKTDYQIENGLRLVRTDDGEYDIELGSATTKDAEMGVVVELLRMMQQMMLMNAGVAPSVERE